MYDLELVVPVCNHDQYAQRLIDFKEYGLLNIGDKKVLLTLLAGPERIPDIQAGWPKEVTVRVVPGNNTQVTAKTYQFFSNYPGEIQARWTAKFDDDTINDVTELVDKLDLEFDHEREYYVITEFRQEQHKYEDDILREMGYGRWFNEKNIIWHELEGCVVSQAALTRILGNETAIEFMRRRSDIPQGFNDYALACAARICKIYPSDAYFMTRWPMVGELTIFGGNFAHIHAIGNDVNDHAFDLFKRMLRNDMGGGSPLYPDVVNQEFVFRSPMRGGIQLVKLLPNGLVSGSSEVQLWHLKSDSTLEFLRSNGNLVCSFKGNANSMEGIYASGSSPPTSLRRLATS